MNLIDLLEYFHRKIQISDQKWYRKDNYRDQDFDQVKPRDKR